MTCHQALLVKGNFSFPEQQVIKSITFTFFVFPNTLSYRVCKQFATEIHVNFLTRFSSLLEIIGSVYPPLIPTMHDKHPVRPPSSECVYFMRRDSYNMNLEKKYFFDFIKFFQLVKR